MNKNRILSLWLAFLLFFTWMPIDFLTVSAQGDSVTISSVESSADKAVILTAAIITDKYLAAKMWAALQGRWSRI